ncbi:MAG: hypothetical protein WB783_11315 [Arenicellales bacterium]
MIRGLAHRDATLWSRDAGVRRDIENRLGWLDAPAFMDHHAARIAGFAERVRADGYGQAVLLGMGGSSLAPEVFAAILGGGPASLALTVLDSTSPQQVQHVTRLCERGSTLFIVSSKSGTTAETGALEAYFFEWARQRFDRPGEHFVAITDPGSPLEALARRREYREIFLNPADIGGRFSALSFFGLVPAALAGVDLAALRSHLPVLDAAPALVTDACRLGRTLGSLARAGRNKLTLHLSPGLTPAAAWIEQLIDESTGKDGTGIVVVAGEARLAPDRYGPDRVFVVVDPAGEPAEDDWIEALAGLRHPVARWRIDSPYHLGAELYRWEIATALAGRELGVNPFDEPDVNDSKAMTRTLLERGEGAARRLPETTDDMDRLLAEARAGDYVAILAYLAPSPANRRRLADWAAGLGRRTGLPCCVGFGPRYLHSSGQLHKGGPNQGLFIVLTLDSDFDLPVPGSAYGFKSLIEAQANGDLRVLEERGRRVVHLSVRDESALAELIDATI